MTFGGFNDSIVVALCIFTVVTGARVAYGSWFWEQHKSWWHTEREIEKLRSDRTEQEAARPSRCCAQPRC
jgi:hypothetical protein